MSTIITPEWMCGFETGDALAYEFDESSTGVITGMSVVAVPGTPTPPTGFGAYCLRQDSAGTGTRTKFPRTNSKERCVSAYWMPKVNPTAGAPNYPAEIIGFRTDYSGTGGVTVAWSPTDKKLKLFCGRHWSSLATGTTVYDAATPNWYQIKLRARVVACYLSANCQVYAWNAGTSAWDLTDDFAFGDHLENDYVADNLQYLTVGRIAGNNAQWYLENIYLMPGYEVWPPTGLMLAYKQPTSVASNSTNWKWWNGAAWVDDATNEYLMVDESPPNDADYDYVRRALVNSNSIQTYGHASFGLGAGDNVLAVQAGFRARTSTVGNCIYNAYIRYGGANILKSVTKTTAGWLAAENYVVSTVKPDGTPWAYNEVDSAEMGHDMKATSGNGDVSQAWMYVAYGPDCVAPDPIQRSEQVV